MLNPGRSIIVASFLFLIAAPGFAADLLVSFPQDEQIDPAPTASQNVRPGGKASFTIDLWDKLESGGWSAKGRRADEFDWEPNCDVTSAACPTVTLVPGSPVVTINIPICFPVGTTTYTVTMPNPPAGESAPAAAKVSLTNTEAPSICPGEESGKEFSKKSTGGAPGSAANGTDPQARAAQAAAAQASSPAAQAQAQRGGYGGGFGGRSGDPYLDRMAQQRAWAAQYAAEQPVYSNGAQRGFNYGEQSEGATVISCEYRGNRLICGSVKSRKAEASPKRKLPARKAKVKKHIANR